MKALLFVFVFFISANVFAQEKVLSISNNETGNVTEFKQNQRVRVKTTQGGKVRGNLKIVDDTQIMVRNILIPISNIERIKPNPIVLNILFSGTLFIIGGYGVLGGLIVLAWGGAGIGIAAILVGGASIAGGILSPNILPATRLNTNTNIKVKTIM